MAILLFSYVNPDERSPDIKKSGSFWRRGKPDVHMNVAT
jgi:hypothetical protein